eukprot:1334333-Amorphochlora_amoeboformis.AAC.1
MAAACDEEAVRERLLLIDCSQSKINDTSDWLIAHPEMAEMIVRTWKSIFDTGTPFHFRFSKELWLPARCGKHVVENFDKQTETFAPPCYMSATTCCKNEESSQNAPFCATGRLFFLGNVPLRTFSDMGLRNRSDERNDYRAACMARHNQSQRGKKPVTKLIKVVT